MSIAPAWRSVPLKYEYPLFHSAVRYSAPILYYSLVKGATEPAHGNRFFGSRSVSAFHVLINSGPLLLTTKKKGGCSLVLVVSPSWNILIREYCREIFCKNERRKQEEQRSCDRPCNDSTLWSNKREIRRSTNGLVHKCVRFRILRRYLRLLLNVAIIFGLLVQRIPRSNLPVVERNIRFNYNSRSKHLFPLISVSFQRLIALLLTRKNIRGKKHGRTKEENRSYRTTYLWVIADRRLLWDTARRKPRELLLIKVDI